MKKIITSYLLFLMILPIMFIGEVNAQKAKAYETPLREVAIIATTEGYYPKSIAVFQGERVRFFVTGTTDDADCFVIDQHQVFLSAEKGKINEAEAVFKNPGKYKFYCPSHKMKGSIQVISKVPVNSVDKKKKGRGVASESDQESFWRPRSY